MRKQYRIRYNSKDGDLLTLVRLEETTRVFRPTRKRLYAPQVLDHKCGAAMVTTVKENEKSFTKREVKRAMLASRTMTIVGRPSRGHMNEIVGLKNSTIAR